MPPLRTVAIVAGSALVLAACSTSVEGPSASRPPAGPERTFTLDAPMTGCSIGGIDAVCGSLTVPEDRGAPNGRTIDVNVAVVPATDPSPAPDPVFFLAGGPGGAATTNWGVAPSMFPEVHARHDIVLVDQRGTGGSHPLILPEAPDMTGRSPAEALEELRAWLGDTLSRLPGDPAMYTTSAFVDDLDDVRRALGFDRIDLYGGSYGVTSALYYLRQHEAHVRAIVLDSGTLLDVPIFERVAPNAQRSFDSVVARCEADAGCHAAFPDPAGDLETAMRALGEEGVRTDVRDPFTDEPIVLTADALAGTVEGLLSARRGGEIPRLLHLAASGDLDAAAWATADLAVPPEDEPDRLVMSWAIRCSEAWARFDPDRVRALGEGSFMADAQIDGAREDELGCGLMPRIASPYDDTVALRSDVPILFLNGSEDPADPPANVAEARRDFPNGLRVVVPTGAHGVGQLGCLPDVVATFLDAGTVDGLDVSCVEAIAPPAFSTGGA